MLEDIFALNSYDLHLLRLRKEMIQQFEACGI